MSADPSDEQLMLAFRAGDARAFEALVRRHRAKVFHFLLRSSGQRARAEELLQETWLRVVRAAPGYSPKARFTTWLYTLARNLCVDGARKDRLRKEEPLEMTSPEGDAARAREPVADPASSPERGAHQAELRPLLEAALAALPAEQREVFVLREYSGMGFKDIAEVTGAPENTVKSRMRYALEGLRKRLIELGVDGVWAEPERVAAG